MNSQVVPEEDDDALVHIFIPPAESQGIHFSFSIGKNP